MGFRDSSQVVAYVTLVASVIKNRWIFYSPGTLCLRFCLSSFHSSDSVSVRRMAAAAVAHMIPAALPRHLTTELHKIEGGKKLLLYSFVPRH